MAAHAKKSASGSKRWINCPGSLPLVASMDPSLLRPSGAAAMLGTCAHGLGELCLREGSDAAEYMDLAIWLDQNEDATVDVYDLLKDCETRSQVAAHLDGADVKYFTRVDERMVEGVQLYLDTVRADLAEMGGPDVTDVWVEKRFDLTWLRPDMFGTSDCTLYQFLGLLRVVDYKNGYLAVDAEGNTQGMYYALGMAQEVDWMFDEVEVVIVQPNSQDGKDVKRFRMSKAELKEFERMLGEASDRVDEAAEALDACLDQVDFNEWASTYLDVGDGSWCTFCDAFATCPAAKAKAEEVAMADFSDDPPELNPVEVHDEESLERLSTIIRWGDYLDRLVKAAQTLGQRRLEQQLPVPGHKLVAGRAPNRVWACADGEVATLVMAAKPDAECYEPPKPPKLKSPAVMEKMGKKVKELVKGKQDEDGNWVVQPLAHTPPTTKLKMVPADDPRPEVVPTAAVDDFADDLEDAE